MSCFGEEWEKENRLVGSNFESSSTSMIGLGLGDNSFNFLIVNAVVVADVGRCGWDDWAEIKTQALLIENSSPSMDFKVLKAIPIINEKKNKKENSFMMAKSIPTNLNIYAQSSFVLWMKAEENHSTFYELYVLNNAIRGLLSFCFFTSHARVISLEMRIGENKEVLKINRNFSLAFTWREIQAIPIMPQQKNTLTIIEAHEQSLQCLLKKALWRRSIFCSSVKSKGGYLYMHKASNYRWWNLSQRDH